MTMQEVEVFVLMDEAGDYVVAKDRENLQEAWDNDIGGETIGARVLRVVLQVELPTPVEVKVDVPASVGKVMMTVHG